MFKRDLNKKQISLCFKWSNLIITGYTIIITINKAGTVKLLILKSNISIIIYFNIMIYSQKMYNLYRFFYFLI